MALVMTITFLARSLSLFLLLCAQLNASLLVSPIRVVMDEQARTGEVTLMNTSNKTNSYKIEWIEYRQDQDDRYVIDENNKSPASRMLTYSPRRVTLEPQQSQKIRLRYRASRVGDGEYRSHLRMTALAPVKQKNSSSTGKGSQLSINVQLSFDLPIIVRKGLGDVAIELGDIEVVPGIGGNKQSMAKLKIPFHHSGSFSGTGTVRVLMQEKPGTEPTQIGIVNHLNVFPDSNIVTKTIPLGIAQVPQGAALKVTYRGSKEYEGRLFAEKVFLYDKQ